MSSRNRPLPFHDHWHHHQELPPQRPHNDPIEVLLGETPQPHQRKRECLDHLTHEQKMNRRKMKNRIAAQTARDRKKYRSQRLEDVIRELLEQNEILKQENELLRVENRDLSERNRSLLARMEAVSETVPSRIPSQQSVVYDNIPAYDLMKEKSGAAVESAAFINAPLPRVQAAPLYLMLHLMISLVLAVYCGQTSSKKSSTTSPKRWDLDFDLDHLVEQLPTDEVFDTQQPSTSGKLCQSDVSPPGNPPTMDESLLNVPRCSPILSTSFPSPSNYPNQMDELLLFEDQKLLDDPMLSSPSDWPIDSPHALSPFSDSFQREFFQMLE
ncbi:unnamed protein product [Nippostrongylus brasiliensis]|uniref:X-box-binding protein 1 n=1 Tax=Nippostrongylus brasiliensis TaxID=27835 RepID=A0A0N4YPB5_NIPBR|nr:unnamed protein product [Nippostrongylus brasiliensis]